MPCAATKKVLVDTLKISTYYGYIITRFVQMLHREAASTGSMKKSTSHLRTRTSSVTKVGKRSAWIRLVFGRKIIWRCFRVFRKAWFPFARQANHTEFIGSAGLTGSHGKQSKSHELFLNWIYSGFTHCFYALKLTDFIQTTINKRETLERI